MSSNWTECAPCPRTSHPLWKSIGTPLPYIDVDNKEWIIFLQNPVNFGDGQHPCCPNSNQSDSYIYDIDEDVFVPFIVNYDRDIFQRFNIDQSQQTVRKYGGGISCVIDNENHILYWLQTYKLYVHARCDGSYQYLIALDIKDWKNNNIKLLNHTIISNKKYPWIGRHATMLLVATNTIHFIIGDDRYSSLCHSQYDIPKKKFSLINKNIHSQYISKKRITKSNLISYLKNLKIGDLIDLKDKMRNFNLSKVLDIKYIDNKSSKSRLQSMKIFVDDAVCKKSYTSSDLCEWVQVNLSDASGNQQLCDCAGKCIHEPSPYSDSRWFSVSPEIRAIHRIAFPGSQTLRTRCLRGTTGIYSKSHRKMIIFGSATCDCSLGFNGMYCKYVNDEYIGCNYSDQEIYCFQLIVYGFIRQFEMNCNYNYNYNLQIPNDLYNLILKYFGKPSDAEWTLLSWTMKIKGCQHGYVQPWTDKDKYSLFRNDFAHLLLNDDNDIFIFGGYTQGSRDSPLDNICKYNIEKNELLFLNHVRCPPVHVSTIHNGKFNGWKAVFCKQTQTVHLFSLGNCSHFSIPLSILNNI